jgi:drug/metabolite transporter (DMT)-like permease
MPSATRPPDAISLLLFGLTVTLGGANFLAVRYSNLELAPLWGAGFRFAVAALLFAALAAALRLPLPRGAELRRNLAFGLLSFALFYALMYWALLQVTAGVATVVMATVPLATLLLAVSQRLERLRARSVVGTALALTGILWMTLGPGHLALPPAALLAMLAAAACTGQGIIVAKGLSHNHPVMTNAVAMATGALLLLASSALLGERWVLPSQREVVWAFGYLITGGSIGLFLVALLVIRRWTASASSYMFVLFPVATMALEAWLTREPPLPQALVGALVVMAGVWFGAFAPRAPELAPRAT